MSNFNNILKSEQLVLLDFSAECCDKCQMLTPILKQLKAVLGNSVKILIVLLPINIMLKVSQHLFFSKMVRSNGVNQEYCMPLS